MNKLDRVCRLLGWPFRQPSRFLCWLTGMSSFDASRQLFDLSFLLIVIGMAWTMATASSLWMKMWDLILIGVWTILIYAVYRPRLAPIERWWNSGGDAMPLEISQWSKGVFIWTFIAWIDITAIPFSRPQDALFDVGIFFFASALWAIDGAQPGKRSAVRKALDWLAGFQVQRPAWVPIIDS